MSDNTRRTSFHRQVGGSLRGERQNPKLQADGQSVTKAFFFFFLVKVVNVGQTVITTFPNVSGLSKNSDKGEKASDKEGS